MIIQIDLDGTLFDDCMYNWRNAKPRALYVKFVNLLHDEGHKIVLATSRPLYEKETKLDTIRQIRDAKIKYDELIYKPWYDLQICDKTIGSMDTLMILFKKFYGLRWDFGGIQWEPSG